jgi:hypothetical protein
VPILDLYAPTLVNRHPRSLALLAARVWPTHETQSEWKAWNDYARKNKTRVQVRT